MQKTSLLLHSAIYALLVMLLTPVSLWLDKKRIRFMMFLGSERTKRC